MADKIRGITIELSGDTSKLVKSLKNVDNSIKSTQKSLKDVDRLLKLDPKNTELLKQKQQLLGKQVEDTKKKLDDLNKVQKEMDAQGVDKASAQYQALQREIISTEHSLEDCEKAFKDFGSVSAQQIAGIGKQMQEVGNQVEQAGQKISKISAAAAGAEAAIVGIGIKAITTADDLATLAQQTGLSTADLQKMQYAADRVDVSFDDMVGALGKVKKNMTGQPQLWQALGINVRNANGSVRDAKIVFFEALNALSKIEDETLRDQVAMKLFGKSADQLAGIIDDGGRALFNYGQEAEELGLILSEDLIGSLTESSNQLDKAKAQLQAGLLQLGATIAQVLAPIIEKLAAAIQKVVQFMQSLTPQQAKVIMIIVGIVAALGPLLIIIGKIIVLVGQVLTFAPMIVSAIGTIGTALSGLFTFLAANPYVIIIAAIVAAVVALTVLIVRNIDTIKAALSSFRDWVAKLFSSIAQTISNICTGIYNFIRNIINTIIGWFRSLLNMFSGVAASFGGTQFHMSGMATGGTLASGSAIVGEHGPELLTMVGNKAQITPLTNNQAQSALNAVGGSGGNTVVEVNFTGSLSQLARVLQPEIKVETSRRGVSLLKA